MSLRGVARQYWVSSRAVWCRLVIHGPDGTVLHARPLYGAGRPTMEDVDRLARLRVELSRRGRALSVAEPCPELADLIDLAGLRMLVGWAPRRVG